MAKNPSVSQPVSVRDRPLELSGCAVVDGGVLVVEDELVGSVLFMTDPGAAPLAAESIKLERRKKERAPYASAFKLFPFQDFEDIATDRAETVYLLGSHNGKGGERRPDREFLFYATWDKKQGELKVRGEHYRLLEGLVSALGALGVELGLSTTKLEAEVNAEGLALMDGRLYVGLRAPLTPEGHGIVVSASVKDVFKDGKPATWIPEAVDLDGGGVRALDLDPVSGSILVISGPAKDGGQAERALWTWTPGEAPVRRVTFDETIARKKPEGVCRLSEADGGDVLVVLDGEGGAGGEVVRVAW